MKESSRGHCPQCGAELQLYDFRCWLCGWSPAASRAVGSSPMAPPVLVSPPRREAGPLQYSIGGLLVVTTVIAVCLGALRVAPGLGILLIFFLAVGAVPATIRAKVLRSRRPAGGSSQATRGWTLAYVESFAITAGAITVGIIACGVVAFVAVFVGCGGMPSLGSQVSNNIATVLLFASPVIGLMAAGLIYWMTWPRNQSPG
jgi:hypothetical protein